MPDAEDSGLPDKGQGKEEGRPSAKRRLLLRPGQGLVLIAIGLVGAGLLGELLLLVCVLATTVLVAQNLEQWLARRNRDEDGLPEPRAGLGKPRIQFGLTTLLLAVTVIGAMLGLSVWDRPGDMIYESPYPVSVYGFPFRCLWVSSGVKVDFLRFGADIAVVVGLIAGITMEIEHFRQREDQ